MRYIVRVRHAILVIGVFGLTSGCAEQAHQGSDSALPTISISAGSDPPSEMSVLVREADVFALGLARIQCIAPLPNGGVAVFDGATPALVTLDSTGTVLERLGREGSGPGEYRKSGGFDCLSTTTQGLIALIDGGNGRVLRWSPTRESLSSIPLPGLPGGLPPRIIATDTSAYVHLTVSDARAEYKRSFDPLSWGYVNLGANGQALDTIRPLALWGSEASDQIFGSFQFALPVGSAVVRASSERPALLVRYQDGREKLFELPWNPVEVTAQEATELEEIMTYRSPPSAPIPPFPGIAPSKAHFSSVSVGLDESVWLRRAVRAETGKPRAALSWAVDPPSPIQTVFEPVVYFGIGSNGAFKGQLRLPQTTQAVAAGEDAMWVLFEGDGGEQHLGRWNIRQTAVR